MFFQSNQELLKQRFHVEIEPVNSTKYETIIAKNGDPTMVVIENSKKYAIHSKFDPRKEANRWTQSIQGTPGTTYFVYGFGLGYHIENLLDNCEEDDTVVVIEPSKELLSFSLNARDYTDLIMDGRFVLYIEPSEDDLDFLYSNHINYVDLDSLKFQHLSPYEQLFPSHYELTTEKFFKKISEKKVDLNTVFYFAEKWQKNYVRNLSSIVNSSPFSVLQETNSFENRPIVIVSAGPSLDKNIQLLREIDDKALIICAGSTIRSFAKHDILPHIVVTIDGGEVNAQHFRSLSIKDYHLFFSGSCHPEIPTNHKGPAWYFQNWEKHFDDWINDEVLQMNPGFLRSGPSVANFCFDLAVKLKGNPICFIGQDLAYTNNRTHASGSLFENTQVSENKHSLSIPGYHRDTVLTDVSMYSMLKYFENYIYVLRRQGYEDPVVINATEGGAKIKGTEQMSFRQFIDKYCKDSFDPRKKLDILHKNNRFDRNISERLINLLEKYVIEVEQIKTLAGKGKKISEKLVSCYRLQKNNDIANLIEKLDQIDASIKELEGRHVFLSIMMQVGIFKVLKGFKPVPNETEREKGIRIGNQSMTLYNSLQHTAKEMIPVINEVIEDLKGSEI
ncbi:motility associated factor glycosyltransferase family protein [Effusibacillus lacus]|uniref:Motility accessory factor n=1 Tax=Effusibacillus lacus TaxID=1348429 RepID=A0A292YJG1_9BACL|nr:6-hydroxymethylpterin diphosphokinase MptE-like protein [Effusibacillus lacus]TCS69821.1 hypothetical protein EDD64_13553 [Effusibacillus lacus]GAX88903.1 hypothetical protein EFBL_0517 [Effusibacillus lacus]